MKSKTNKKERPTNKGFVIATVCLGVAVAILLVCVIILLPKGSQNAGDGDVTTGGTSVNGSSSTITVKTPYCDMKYPSEFNDYLEIKEFNENGIYTKQFLCRLSSIQYKLFAVHFGEGATGDFFGYLTTDEGKISVYIECYERPETELIGEEEQMTYYYMMNGINDIARSISETPGYLTH